MSETEYSYTITHHRRTGRYTAEIIGPGTDLTSPHFESEDKAAEWAGRYIEAKTAGLVQPAHQPAPTARVATSTPRVQVQRQPQQVAAMLGVRPPRPSRGCYYCGVPLVNGICED